MYVCIEQAEKGKLFLFGVKWNSNPYNRNNFKRIIRQLKFENFSSFYERENEISIEKQTEFVLIFISFGDNKENKK